MQQTLVQSLIQEDPTCPGAAKPVGHNNWACDLDPRNHNYWSPCALKPVLCNTRSHCSEKPVHCTERSPCSPQLEKSPRSNEDPTPPQINKQVRICCVILNTYECDLVQKRVELGQCWEGLTWGDLVTFPWGGPLQAPSQELKVTWSGKVCLGHRGQEAGSPAAPAARLCGRERPRQGLSASVSPLTRLSSFCRTVPQRMWSHFWKVSTQGLFVAMFWPLIPQFVCNCLFYWALYFNPIINIDLVVKEVRRLETQVLWLTLPRFRGTLTASLPAELWGEGEADFLFSAPSKQGAALCVRGHGQVPSLVPWQQGLAPQGLADTAAAPPTQPPSSPGRKAQPVTSGRDSGSSEDTQWVTIPACSNLSDWQEAPRAGRSPGPGLSSVKGRKTGEDVVIGRGSCT